MKLRNFALAALAAMLLTTACFAGTVTITLDGNDGDYVYY